jgi:dihydropyrimidinase
VSRIDYNVFEGFRCTGLPRATLSHGEITWLDGDLRATAGTGKYVARDPFPAVAVADATWRELNAPRGVARADVTP